METKYHNNSYKNCKNTNLNEKNKVKSNYISTKVSKKVRK